MNRVRAIGLALSLVLAVPSVAPACEAAGPNAHIGVIIAVGLKAFTLKDAESGMNLTFLATPELLKGLARNERVTVIFTTEGQKLVAKSVKKEG